MKFVRPSARFTTKALPLPIVNVPLFVKFPAVVKFAPLLIVKLPVLAIVLKFVSAFVLFVVLKISAEAPVSVIFAASMSMPLLPAGNSIVALFAM